MSLVDSCKELSGFSVNRQFITSPIHRENPLGDIATLKLYGGMDVVLFAVPLNLKLKPMWKAFSRGMIGMMMLCDSEGMKDIEQLVAIKNYILSIRRIPILHTFAAAHEIDKRQEEDFRKVLGMKRDEPLFIFEPMNRDRIFQIFNTFFSYLLKDEYISA